MEVAAWELPRDEVTTMQPSDADSPIGIERVTLAGETVILRALGTAPEGRCPACGTASRSVHDRYVRRPRDVPWRGRAVRLVLTVRRFRCVAARCPRRTFAEDFAPRLPRHARRTADATALLVRLAGPVSGEVGARIAGAVRLPCSADTLLRLVRRAAPASVATPRVLGVDDLALRRGHRYATLLVDLETHRPVDLLADRTAETLATWLGEHPGVETIARDRSEAYAEGARQGAPAALQVADRFHLLQNASAALDELLQGRRRRIEAATPDPTPDGSVPAAAVRPLSPARERALARRAARRARWERVLELATAGRSLRGIARELGINRRTVRRLVRTPLPAPGDPVVRPRPGGLRSPKLQPYVSYLQDRWQAGCTNASQLYRELCALGYGGSRTLLDQAIRPWRPPRPPKSPHRRGAHSVRWLCLRPPDQLTPEEHTALEQLLRDDPTVAAGYDLLQQFRAAIAAREPRRLDAWIAAAQASQLPSFISLANGIAADRGPIDAALTLPWSTGMVEGHVCRVKLLKRMGYGRAKLDLLRSRVLLA
jgi:transposase